MRSHSSQFSIVLPLFFIALGFYLRVSGISFGLPFLYHADEPIVVNHALAYGAGDLNPHFFKIPPLASYILFFAYGVLFLIGKVFHLWQSAADFETLFYRNPSLFYITGRLILGVIPGTLSLIILWNMLRNHFNLLVANIALMLFSVNFLHVRDSHYIYADIPLLLIMLLGFQAIFYVVDQPLSTSRHLRVGFFVGAAAAAKYNGVFLLLSYLAAISSGVSIAFLFAAGFVSALTFFVFNPFAFLSLTEFLTELKTQSHSHTFTGWIHHLSYSLFEGIGMSAVYLSLLSATPIVKTAFTDVQRKKLLSVSVFLIGYYLVIVFRGQPYDRYALPLITPLILLTSATLYAFWQNPKWGKPVAIVFLLMVFVPNTIKSFSVVQLMKTEDIRTSAKKWIEANIPPDSRIALGWDFYMPRLSFSAEQLKDKRSELSQTPSHSRAQEKRLSVLDEISRTGTSYQLFFLSADVKGTGKPLLAKPLIEKNITKLREKKIQYVLVEINSESSWEQPFYHELSRSGKLIKTFSPYTDESQKAPYDIQPLTGLPFQTSELMARKQNGLPLYLYSLETQ